jgi:hypothetical protein
MAKKSTPRGKAVARKQFQPQTIEVTRQLDIAGLDEREVARLRQALFTGTATDDLALKTAVRAVDPSPETDDPWEKEWKDWGRYSPNPPRPTGVGESEPGKITKRKAR